MSSHIHDSPSPLSAGYLIKRPSDIPTMYELEDLISQDPELSIASSGSPVSACQKCKKEVAEVFQVTGDFCLQCWQDETHPDIDIKIRQT